MVSGCNRLRYILGPKGLVVSLNHAIRELFDKPDRKLCVKRRGDRCE